MDATTEVRVPMVEEAQATGRVAELYAEIKQATGLPFVPDMFRLTSSRPDLLEAVVAGYKGMYLGGVLPRQTRELISAWTSKVNQCPYCVGTHNFFFRAFGGPEETAKAVETASGVEELPVDERTKVLLRLVTKVSREAYKITEEDWLVAGEAGWSREELLEAFFTASMFNFITRMVDGLGLGYSVAASRVSQQPVAQQPVSQQAPGGGDR
ncbi:MULTISPECIES: carboxymuconolactone decarboxylase family protein [Actinosynnema]|uniref:carboxymuconolactone decarboxylase family protein n=1 Tax=Actinosynnema TaxID=40566 RepID=UPI0020A33ABD|nr:carboxymuconolactone decarboxylase family protein [Actinosynnema pretiosum]MCP2094966.1 putative peroxidase-related enzyme [Actinosynnema pretiosum]